MITKTFKTKKHLEILFSKQDLSQHDTCPMGQNRYFEMNKMLYMSGVYAKLCLLS